MRKSAAFIRGRRLIIFLYVPAAFIRGRRLFEGGVYSSNYGNRETALSTVFSSDGLQAIMYMMDHLISTHPYWRGSETNNHSEYF